jgi:acetolactate synthase-1/2/3 large subunit
MYDRGDPAIPGRLVRIEIDPEQMRRGAVPEIPLLGDAALGAARLLEALGPGDPAPGGPARAARLREAARAELTPPEAANLAALEALRAACPEAIMVGDSTAPAYAGNLYYAAPAPRRWFNAATGYGALGYGLPAAIGAGLATGRPVICLAGDGGLQFSLGELGAAAEEGLPLAVLVWNNAGYGEIRDFMEAAGVPPVGVDLATPDFPALGRAYGLAAWRVEAAAELAPRAAALLAAGGPALLEVPEAAVAPRARGGGG